MVQGGLERQQQRGAGRWRSIQQRGEAEGWQVGMETQEGIVQSGLQKAGREHLARDKTMAGAGDVLGLEHHHHCTSKTSARCQVMDQKETCQPPACDGLLLGRICISWSRSKHKSHEAQGWYQFLRTVPFLGPARVPWGILLQASTAPQPCSPQEQAACSDPSSALTAFRILASKT